jgi:hypothetical protein
MSECPTGFSSIAEKTNVSAWRQVPAAARAVADTRMLNYVEVSPRCARLVRRADPITSARRC